MWLVAKNSSLLSPDLTLIILPISFRNLRVLGSIGPRTSMHIGKNSIEGRAFPYFFIFSSAALAAAKPHSLLVRFTYRSARVPGTVTSHAKHLPALQGISVHPSGRLPSCAEMPDDAQNAPGILWADVVSSPNLDEAFTLVKRHNKRPRLNVSLEANSNGGTTSINNNGETTSNNNNENTANIKTAKKPTKVIGKKVVEDCKLRADKNLIKKSVFSMSNISKCHRKDVVEFLTSNGINVITCYPVLKKTEISSDKNFDEDDQE
ncbi:hypothetical protein HELRODRAFT_163210 [Helobdella robusta]|uniref:Uncharacterized protein n=1 Tax=Helobdella robusta TaxID=6412 RepID=T1ETT0_HELRO|nr:hypothetical protein HELRODRAFT_163210 [Helobdella robusta]ESN96176.1 hypothetical protein HELRODRAFT_163210 [Helobdella robusta]